MRRKFQQLECVDIEPALHPRYKSHLVVLYLQSHQLNMPDEEFVMESACWIKPKNERVLKHFKLYCLSILNSIREDRLFESIFKLEY
ncbi:casein kinase II subunit alpha'-interacting protein isoform X3 [Panthera uncia]|nr:casein kinase II subunit alpha'-interacting protein isoform X3 [Panthera uncia]